MGRTITHLGPLGSGQVAKAVNQVVLCGTYLGVAEGIVLAMKAGLDPEAVVGALAGGAAGSWVGAQAEDGDVGADGGDGPVAQVGGRPALGQDAGGFPEL
jgi:hypothetical protein